MQLGRFAFKRVFKHYLSTANICCYHKTIGNNSKRTMSTQSHQTFAISFLGWQSSLDCVLACSHTTKPLLLVKYLFFITNLSKE